MSLRKAINDQCRDCIVDELAAGSAVAQIELCTSVDCLLWRVRPIRVQRIPYSAAVLAEYGLAEGKAAARLANPRNPAAFACASSRRLCTAQGEADSMEEAA